jgi:1,4-alpha-glucan branching enzyme
MISKEPASADGLARVTFELPASLWAGRVNLVGEFNAWDPLATPMTQDRIDGRWKVAVDLEAGHRYRFRYLVDNQDWLYDAYADDNVETPAGSFDPVVDLTGSNNQAPS